MSPLQRARRRTRPSFRGLSRLRALPLWAKVIVLFAAVAVVRSYPVHVSLIGGGAVLLGLARWWWRRRRGPNDWQHAERLAAAHMRRRGGTRVRVTSGGADGGLDVVSDRVAAQVKHTAASVGRPVVQQTLGAASALGLDAAVYSSGGFTAPAIAFARDQGIALYELTGRGQVRVVWQPRRGVMR